VLLRKVVMLILTSVSVTVCEIREATTTRLTVTVQLTNLKLRL